MMTLQRPRLWIDRVVDSDTLVVWLEATPDVRVRYRVRIKGIEGGELGTEEGAAGMARMAEVTAIISQGELHWQGAYGNKDQHGRLVGDIFDAEGQRLSARLLQCPTHWHRTRSGIQRRN
jgi:endonuclease YncB( thermonuclease family)